MSITPGDLRNYLFIANLLAPSNEPADVLKAVAYLDTFLRNTWTNMALIPLRMIPRKHSGFLSCSSPNTTFCKDGTAQH